MAGNDLTRSSIETETLVIGAGPAGLTTAYALTRTSREVVVVERDPVYVGGISRTVNYKGYLFDIGGHRFFSKSAEIEDLWTEILGDQMLERPRSSRIYYNEKLFSYPLRAADSLLKLGPVEAARCVLSYARARAFPYRDPRNFEQWVVNNFGRRLFEIFFKTYTEKVWGMACSEISADWAAQRIKGLNLFQAIVTSLGRGKSKPENKSEMVKTLIDRFRYPKFGPGQMWQRTSDLVIEQGGQVLMGARPIRIEQRDSDRKWIAVVATKDGCETRIVADHLVSSAAVDELVELLGADDNPALVAAKKGLRYRDFIIVGLIARGAERFKDNWIYIHDPSVRVGRIQNFKSWSPHMVPEPGTASYGMEYFCFEGDGLWSSPDDELIRLATTEIEALGLVAKGAVFDGAVVRQRKAYPVYDEGYTDHLRTIRDGLARRFTGLHMIGRNGMHKYNNQDHAMMTGLLTARNIISGGDAFDVWGVNEDAEYHEEGATGTRRLKERLVPNRAG